MSRQRWFALGGAVAFVIVVIGFIHFFEWHESEVTLPPRGEARYNELFALGKALRAQGFEVESRATLNLDAMAPDEGDLIVLATDPNTISWDDALALLEWVHAGGRLAFALPPAAGASEAPLAQQLDLRVIAPSGDDKFSCVKWRADGIDGVARYCTPVLLAESEDESWTWSWPVEDNDAYFAARGDYGDGAWLAVPNFGFLAGRALEDRHRVALTWALLQPMLGDGRVHLIYSVDVPPLYVLLVQRGWPIWIPALLALLAWLWRKSQRLGPELPLPPPDRRALLEHIRAAGEFVFRRKRGLALHAALKRRFDARLAREFPPLAALSGDEQVRAIATAWKLDPITVRLALMPPDLTHPEAFTAAIRSLSRLLGEA